MSPATQRTAFDPCFTTKAVERGLGLAPTKGIESTPGGALRLESTVGKGTAFTVYPPHVRVVTDGPTVLRMLCRTLEKAGFPVTCARNGQEAVETPRRRGHTVDCVLPDLNAPRLDAEKTFHEQREIPGDVRVILSVGHSEPALLPGVARGVSGPACGVRIDSGNARWPIPARPLWGSWPEDPAILGHTTTFCGHPRLSHHPWEE